METFETPKGKKNGRLTRIFLTYMKSKKRLKDFVQYQWQSPVTRQKAKTLAITLGKILIFTTCSAVLRKIILLYFEPKSTFFLLKTENLRLAAQIKEYMSKNREIQHQMKGLVDKTIEWEINQNMVVKNHMIEHNLLTIRHENCQATLHSAVIGIGEVTQILSIANGESLTIKEVIKRHNFTSLDFPLVFELLKIIK